MTLRESCRFYVSATFDNNFILSILLIMCFSILILVVFYLQLIRLSARVNPLEMLVALNFIFGFEFL